MPRRSRLRAPARAVPLSLLALSALALPVAAAAPAGAGPAASAATRVVQVFPTDALTVPDPEQLTGRRIDLPRPDCEARRTDCHTVRLLNQLDGFDLDPRLALTFDADVDPYAVAASTRITREGGSWSTGVDRVVYDAETHTVYAHPQRQLAPGTRHVLRVDPSRGVPAASSTFTTLSATDGLRDMRRQLASGEAFRAAGIDPDERGLRVDAAVPAEGTTLTYVQDRGSTGGEVPTPVPNVSATGAGTYVFGSFLAPQWISRRAVIEQTPTGTDGPEVQRAQRLPFVLILPAGEAPEGGWPTAVFGHGFTRSDADVFLAASQNAARGLATIATTVVGHGYGRGSAWQITRGGQTTTVPAYGRGVDVVRDGVIGSTEGVSPAPQPALNAQISNRDGLRQTAADVMTLLREIGRGVDVDDDGATDLERSGTRYYGQSFGGIYGTMLAGADPRAQVLGLNVPGGPITEIARLSPAFRPGVAQALGGAEPSLLNGGVAGFTESLPLAGEGPVTDPAPGALAIQQFLADQTWINRPGSPETFAPALGRKTVLMQVAYGDQTVPNPTSYTIIRAGGLQDRTTLYRNDKVEATRTQNPHGFLLNPAFAVGFALGNTQMSTFLADPSAPVIDPDGPAPVFEVPIEDPTVLLDLNFPAPTAP